MAREASVTTIFFSIELKESTKSQKLEKFTSVTGLKLFFQHWKSAKWSYVACVRGLYVMWEINCLMKTNLEIGLTVKYLKRNRVELCTPYRDCKYSSGIIPLVIIFSSY